MIVSIMPGDFWLQLNLLDILILLAEKMVIN